MTPEEFEDLLHEYASAAQEVTLDSEWGSGRHEAEFHMIQEQLIQVFRQVKLENGEIHLARKLLGEWIALTHTTGITPYNLDLRQRTEKFLDQ